MTELSVKDGLLQTEMWLFMPQKVIFFDAKDRLLHSKR